MASDQAIAAVSQGIVASFESFARGSRDFSGLSVVLIQHDEPSTRLPSGLSVLLRGVTPSTTHRNLPTPADRALPPVAIDLHYLVTAWGTTAEEQQRLLGWCLRTLHDAPILTAELLNRADPTNAVFGPDERVELLWEPNPPAQLGEIPARLLPSLPYVARTVMLDSDTLVAGVER